MPEAKMDFVPVRLIFIGNTYTSDQHVDCSCTHTQHTVATNTGHTQP